MSTIQAYFQAAVSLFHSQPYLQAIVVAVLAYVIAKFVCHYVMLGLFRLIDRLNLALGKPLLRMLQSPLFWSMFCLGLSVAVTRLPLSDEVSARFVSALISVVIIMWAVAILRIAKFLLQAGAEQPDQFTTLLPTTLPLFENLVAVLIFAGAIHQIFSAWHVDMTALLASAGILGLAVGMAAKDLLTDIFAGVLILTDPPYKIGDFIIVDVQARGVVSKIGIRQTSLLTRDNVEVTLPNSLMGNSKITNESGGPSTSVRLRFEITVAYGADVVKVKQLLLEAVAQCKQVLKSPEPKARVVKISGSGVDLLLLYWIEDSLKRPAAIGAINEGVYARFLEHKIDMPHGEQDVYIKQIPIAKQDISIKEVPVGRQVIDIKEMPSLFGRPS